MSDLFRLLALNFILKKHVSFTRFVSVFILDL
jgi:hypothetical protein